MAVIKTIAMRTLRQISGSFQASPQILQDNGFMSSIFAVFRRPVHISAFSVHYS
jgi:hypothetical protein